MKSFSKISKFILELIVIIFIMFITAKVLIPISDSLKNQEPISIKIELVGELHDKKVVDDKLKDIEYLIKDSQYKYVDVATNRVYNVITVIGIFFTVFVLVITIYQYLKSKSYEEKIALLENEIEESSKNFQKEINIYNSEIKSLVNANILFANAQSHFMSNAYLKSAKEYEELIKLSENNGEILKVFDIEQVKRSAILAYNNANDFLNAARILESIIDFNRITIKEKENFNDYLEFCQFKLKSAYKLMQVDQLKEIIDLYERALMSIDDFELDEIELEEEIRNNLAETKWKIGKLYYDKGDSNQAKIYLKGGFDSLYFEETDLDYQEYVVLLNNIYLSDNVSINQEFKDFFVNYDRLIEWRGRSIYIFGEFEDEKLCKLNKNSILISNVLNEYVNRISGEYKEEERKFLIRKMYLFFKVHENFIKEFNIIEKNEEKETIVNFLEVAEEIRKSDIIKERAIGINPFKDSFILRSL